jgi:DNA-directed RNA polymerase subunit RPC12/RpoP
MVDQLNVKCRHCGHKNDLKMGRVYTIFKCAKCQGEIDLDGTLTFELVAEDRPVKMRRDTVTVGFRARTTDDKVVCDVCGSKAEVEFEDVLGSEKTYRCMKCGKQFGAEDPA